MEKKRKPKHESNERLISALDYLERGWSVIPIHGIANGKCTCGETKCSRPGKHPIVNWAKYQKVRADAEQIKRWWKKRPEAGIGIVTGDISGIAVLDIDGPEGTLSLQKAGIEIPETITVETGGGGFHYYSSTNGAAIANKVAVLKKVDIRGNGGFVVAPPSGHVSGGSYRWAKDRGPEEVGLAPFLAGLLNSQVTKRTARTGAIDWREPIQEGQRNAELARRAGSLFGKGLGSKDVLEQILLLNEARCKPPLADAEVIKVVESISEREQRKGGLDHINRLLEVPVQIVEILKMVSRDREGEWSMVLEDGEVIHIGPTSKLLSFAHVRARIADVLHHNIDVKRGQWNGVAQAILKCAVVREDDAPQDEMREWLLALLVRNYEGRMGPRKAVFLAYDMSQVEQRWALVDHLQNGNPRESVVAMDTDGRIYLRLSAGTMWVAHMLKPRFDTAKDLAVRLQQLLGFKSKALDIVHQGRRARVKAQVSPTGLAGGLGITIRPFTPKKLEAVEATE